MSRIVSQLEASGVDWTVSHVSRIDAKQFSCVPVGNPVAISTFSIDFLSNGVFLSFFQIVKGTCSQQLQPCKVSMWYIMVYFSTYAVDFWIAFEY